MSLSPPVVVCAANRMTYLDSQGVQHVLVIAGARHHDGVMNPVIRALTEDDADRVVKMEQGFIDQHNQFLTRYEAWRIAEPNGQIKRRCGGDDREGGWLYSENLY